MPATTRRLAAYLIAAAILPNVSTLRGQAPASGRARPAIVVMAMHDTAAHLYRGSRSGIATRTRKVIRDSASFDRFFARRDTNYLRDPRFDTIDFSKQDVIVAAMGTVGAEGPGIAIDTVLETGTTRRVIVRTILVPSTCMEAQQLMTPGDIVVVPRSAMRTTIFVERVTHRRDCEGRWDRPSKPGRIKP